MRLVFGVGVGTDFGIIVRGLTVWEETENKRGSVRGLEELGGWRLFSVGVKGFRVLRIWGIFCV